MFVFGQKCLTDRPSVGTLRLVVLRIVPHDGDLENL